MTLEQFTNWYDELPILPYGEISNEEILDWFTVILQWKREGKFISDTIPKHGTIEFTVTEYWLLLGLLSTDCLEYGSSPRGAWLTDFGTELLEFLKAGKHLEYLSRV